MEEKNVKSIEKKLSRQLTVGWISLVVNIVLVICVLILTMAVVNLIPQVMNTLDQADELLLEAEKLAESANDAVDEINSVIPAFEAATGNISEISASLTEEGIPKLYESLDTLNSIDIDTLNESIQSLYDVIYPLSTLFGRK